MECCFSIRSLVLLGLCRNIAKLSNILENIIHCWEFLIYVKKVLLYLKLFEYSDIIEFRNVISRRNNITFI